MNNEIGRKLTSLTLMTIMLAGGMVIAAPSMVPEAAAAGQLYVSAENAAFGNTFGGGSVVEVIVKDPNRADTDVAEAEPTVYVDNNTLRMAQGVDGYWYAYIGAYGYIDHTGTEDYDSTDNYLDYGYENSNTNTNYPSGNATTIGQHHLGAALSGQADMTTGATSSMLTATTGVITNPPTLSDYNNTNNVNGVEHNTINADGSSTYGQIGVNGTEWPFIQLYDFTQGAFDIVLSQAGQDEIVTLDYDSSGLDSFAGVEVDRLSATQGSDVHLTITDQALNIDPTNEDIVIFFVGTSGSETVSFTNGTMPGDYAGGHEAETMGFGDNGVLKINYDTNGINTNVFTDTVTADDLVADKYLVFYEGGDNTGVFSNTDDNSESSLEVNTLAKRGTTATIDYNDSAVSFVVANSFGDLDMDESSIGDEWNSGETLAVTLVDQDLNKNTLNSEDMAMTNAYNSTIPSLQVGSPITLTADSFVGGSIDEASGCNIGTFNKICTLTSPAATQDDISRYTQLSFNGTTIADMRTAGTAATYIFVNYDVSEMVGDVSGVTLVDASGTALYTVTGITASDVGLSQITSTNIVSATAGLIETDTLRLNFTTTAGLVGETGDSIYVDIFTFGDRVNNAIYRFLLEESDDNSATFEGDVEFIMLNQLNVDVAATFSGLSTYGSSITMIVHEDMTDEDSPRINYLDLGSDGVQTQIADQVAAPSHSGVVTFDSANYKTADTVVVTLDDQDLNTDSGLLDVYITAADDKVGDGAGSHVLDITFNDVLWQDGEDEGGAASFAGSPDDGLLHSGFTLVETDVDSGIFTGSFQVPATYYDSGSATTVTTTGTDIEVNYNDHRDASGETIEVGAGASVNANTGSVEFDRNVYPVPWGNDTADERFALHSTAAESTAWTASHTATTHSLAQGNVTVHVSVTDADYDVSAFGEDTISDTTVVLKIERGSSEATVATFGNSGNPITETSPTSGVFEYDATIGYRSGPSTNCPTTFATTCVLQGDILTVTYNDVKDASGQAQAVTDSATFDLRNGVLQADKSVYLIGSDMILTLIEPDFDRDNDGAESYTLDLIEWDSDAATTTMGDYAGSGAQAAFDPEPSLFRETGDSTGIFQVVIEIPDTLVGELLDRGEQIDLEYTDWGPAGADYVGQEDESIGLTVYTSNFGATIELDQKVYTWTDLVYITIVAPDHNFDSGLVDEIGSSSGDPIKVATRGNELNNYKLVESGPDTGIFIGEVTLGGFAHDADGDGTTGTNGNDVTAVTGGATGSGPTSGTIATTDNDGLTVSFEFSEDETVVGSALIRWNIGEVQFLESSYPASGTGVIRIIDADMNLNPAAIDNFAIDAWSDSDAGGIDLTVTETNEATGIFEGTVFFTTVNDSSGHRLRVAEGDTVTAEYEDNTLPDPYTTADELDITATTLIGTVVPPLERAPAANLRIVDAFGNSLNAVSVDQQVQLTADLANGQDKEQSFAYLVQIQDGDGVTVSLAWITGSLSSGQSFSPALSWIPTEGGSYTATAFVWESVDNPTALSPPVSTTISVQ